MFAHRLYTGLGVPTDAGVTARITHEGLAGRELRSTDPLRIRFPRVSTEDASSVELSLTVGDLTDDLLPNTTSVLDPLFTLFDFASFGDEVYADVRRGTQNHSCPGPSPGATSPEKQRQAINNLNSSIRKYNRAVSNYNSAARPAQRTRTCESGPPPSRVGSSELDHNEAHIIEGHVPSLRAYRPGRRPVLHAITAV